MIANLILEQLGGNKFVAMTGSKNFRGNDNMLRMSLARNKSKANNLDIILEPDDTYTMRFFHYTAPRMNRKTQRFYEEKITDIEVIQGVYCEQLQEVFSRVTGLYTSLT